MPRFAELPKDMLALPGAMDGVQALGVGTENVAVATLLLTHNYHNDMTTHVLEYALAKPGGAMLGFFGALCLKQAAGTAYRRFRGQMEA